MRRPSKNLPPVYTLVFFEAVARHGSFTKAADELCVTQSAVSKQVRSLEETLRFQLFERQHRGVVLTAAGRELFESTRPLLKSLGDTVSRIQLWHESDVVSVICTQAVAHYWLLPRLVEFQRLRPDITVNVSSTNDICADTCGAFDVGILYGRGGWPGLEAHQLFPEQIYPICSVDFPSPEITSPEQILGLRLIQLDPQRWNWTTWEDWFAHYGVPYSPPRDMLVYNQVTLALSASAKGLGVALGWEFMARDMINSSIIKPLGPFVYDTGISDYLVHARRKPLSEAAQAFKTWLLEAEAA